MQKTKFLARFSWMTPPLAWAANCFPFGNYHTWAPTRSAVAGWVCAHKLAPMRFDAGPHNRQGCHS